MTARQDSPRSPTPRSVTAWIGVAVVAGLLLGLAANAFPALTPLVLPLDLAGDWFIRCLKLLILPVVVTSLVVGVLSIGSLARLGQLGGKAALFYSGTTFIAACLGLFLVNVIQPGVGLSSEGLAEIPDKVQRGQGLTVGAMFGRIFGETFGRPLASLREGDVLTWIALSLLIGVALLAVGERGRPIADLFGKAEAVIMQVVRVVLWTAPLGVLGLLASVLAERGVDAIFALGRYSFTVLLGLGIHGLIVLPLLVALLGRMAPRRWFAGIRPALAVALSTSSSSATLPVTMEACEENLGVPTEVASFVLPLGATMNMDGTAMYEAVAALFVAQVYGMDLSLAQQGVVVVTAMAASVGAAGIPSAGLVTMAMVFEAVGLPLEGIGLILTVDRFLDMGRTMVNVMGDTAGAVILSRDRR